MKYPYLEKISSPRDLKALTIDELCWLANEIRDFLLEKVSASGGHLSSNLGTIELTLALHYVFDSPQDHLIFDVGHQAYTHKILTGRRDDFDRLRMKGGLSGFLKRSESKHDAFGAGHASTSLSAASGFALADARKGRSNHTVAIIGDGSLTGGMAYEALNTIGELRQKLLIVVNDNEMSIDRNVGGLQKSLNDLRTYRGYRGLKNALKSHMGSGTTRRLGRVKNAFRHAMLPSTLFENLGARYYGPIDGHDLKKLIYYLQRLKNLDGPVVLHTLTVKGKGYAQAEHQPDSYHGVGRFDLNKGLCVSGNCDFSGYFGEKMMQLAARDERVMAITAAMPTGTGLSRFYKSFPEQFLDVGIAEQNAVTAAAAMALHGLKPYVAIYSTFLQRAFDQMLHDVALQKADVVFCIDRSGIVGADGETHQGIYDMGYLSLIPGLSVFAPKDDHEFGRILEHSLQFQGPLAIKYPREGLYHINEDDSDLFELEMLGGGGRILLIGYSRMVRTLLEVQKALPELKIDVLNHRLILPLQEEKLRAIMKPYEKIYVVEESIPYGSLGEKIQNLEPRIERIYLKDGFVKQGSVEEILHDYGMSPQALQERLVRDHEDSTR